MENKKYRRATDIKADIKKWFNILRPKTLLASAVPILIGVLFASLQTNINYISVIMVLFCGTSLQTLSNLINDYYDYKKGTDKKDRIGFKRALAQGEVSINQMKKAILINLSFSVLSGIYLIYVGGLPILIIGLFSLFFAWLYTATPYSLSYLGIADIFAFVFYGPVATCGTYYLLANNLSLINQSIYAGCACGCISTMILTVNNLRDRQTDLANGKKSFEVRFGKIAGEIKYFILILLSGVFSFSALFHFSSVSLTPVIVSTILILSGLYLFCELRKAEREKYNKLLFQTSLLNFIYLLLLIIVLPSAKFIAFIFVVINIILFLSA